ncbi:unnamed protein product [Leptosia nina]|uniref:Uncharacterized protein n=1 Tax=Leptosia nina TaxID=320188 RepID=A0AAV1JQM9_9NEOP
MHNSFKERSAERARRKRTYSINSLPYFSIRELSKRSDTLILLARIRRAPKLVFYIQSIQSLMLFVCDITGMPPMFTDAPNHIGFANFCLRTLFHFAGCYLRLNTPLFPVHFRTPRALPDIAFKVAPHASALQIAALTDSQQNIIARFALHSQEMQPS